MITPLALASVLLLPVFVASHAGDSQLDRAASVAVKAAKAKYPSLKDDEIAIAVTKIDRGRGTTETGGDHADLAMYPASTVKLFYLAYATMELQAGNRDITNEYERALHDMIVDSNNDATGLVLDTITGTTGGPELTPIELQVWMRKRQIVNEWFKSLGYQGVMACQKTWNEGPYGREKQGYGANGELRNSLTPAACARLMTEIATDKILKPGDHNGRDWAAFAKTLLSRKIVADGPGADYQSKAFSGAILPKGSRLHSKAGYTDEVKHDIAWVVLPNGDEYVWAIFTRHHSDIEDLVSFTAKSLLGALEPSYAS